VGNPPIVRIFGKTVAIYYDLLAMVTTPVL